MHFTMFFYVLIFPFCLKVNFLFYLHKVKFVLHFKQIMDSLSDLGAVLRSLDADKITERKVRVFGAVLFQCLCCGKV